MKRLLLKKAVAELVYGLMPAADDDTTSGGFRVLTYHSISELAVGDQMTVSPQLFDIQMRHLKENGYRVVGCREAVDMMKRRDPIPPRTVCITFDDGFSDNLTAAAPVLERYDFKATIFITVSFVGYDRRWLTWDQITELVSTGVFSVGSHALSHKKLYGLDAAAQRMEIAGSKEVLEDRLKTPVELFAYPFGCYGSFDHVSADIVRSSGYEGAFTTITGPNCTVDDPYTIKRMRISWFDDEREFAKELAGAYDWYRLWQKVRRTS